MAYGYYTYHAKLVYNTPILVKLAPEPVLKKTNRLQFLTDDPLAAQLVRADLRDSKDQEFRQFELSHNPGEAQIKIKVTSSSPLDTTKFVSLLRRNLDLVIDQYNNGVKPSSRDLLVAHLKSNGYYYAQLYGLCFRLRSEMDKLHIRFYAPGSNDSAERLETRIFEAALTLAHHGVISDREARKIYAQAKELRYNYEQAPPLPTKLVNHELPKIDPGAEGIQVLPIEVTAPKSLFAQISWNGSMGILLVLAGLLFGGFVWVFYKQGDTDETTETADPYFEIGDVVRFLIRNKYVIGISALIGLIAGPFFKHDTPTYLQQFAFHIQNTHQYPKSVIENDLATSWLDSNYSGIERIRNSIAEKLNTTFVSFGVNYSAPTRHLVVHFDTPAPIDRSKAAETLLSGINDTIKASYKAELSETTERLGPDEQWQDLAEATKRYYKLLNEFPIVKPQVDGFIVDSIMDTFAIRIENGLSYLHAFNYISDERLEAEIEEIQKLVDRNKAFSKQQGIRSKELIEPAIADIDRAMNNNKFYSVTESPFYNWGINLGLGLMCGLVASALFSLWSLVLKTLTQKKRLSEST